MLEIGSVIDGKYKILSVIGRGGMSVVYMAINEKANKTWAIKEVRRDGIKDFEIVRQGLIVETEMLKKLNHPHLPSIVDVIEDRETLLIVMDYIEGNPLSRALEEYGAQSQENVIAWAKQLCDVLGYLHSRKQPIIYRDMKPANVMLKPDGNVMLIDFGTAREYKVNNIADTTCLGTIGYAAPEQFGGLGQTDARTDIYCLGATLYHLVTGCNPCEPPYEMRDIRSINPNLSSGLEKIIRKCTQRDPNDRYQTCEELKYDLCHYEEMDGAYQKTQKRKLYTFIGSVCAMVIFLGISVYTFMRSEDKKSENYDVILVRASSPELDSGERIKSYFEAIELNPRDEEAYEALVNFFLEGDMEESGALSKEEASYLTTLKAGLPVSGRFGLNQTIYPFEELKKYNSKGYAKVCYDIGIAYWYDYAVEGERYSQAADWLREASKENEVARIYYEMGEWHRKIKKYTGQNRTQNMYDSYAELWNKLKELENAVTQTEDKDAKILIWKEITNTISDKASYFEMSKVPKEEMLQLLDGVEKKVQELQKDKQYEALQNIFVEVLSGISSARDRVNNA